MLATSKPGKKKSQLRRQRPLDFFFAPKSVAVIGATENPGTVGRTLLWNLVTSPFGGTVYPVNPKRASVLGVKAYPSISDIPEGVDLAVVVTPPPSIPGIIRECGENGVQGAIVISAGFKEIGPEGAELERQLLEAAQAANIRVIGPNCLGVMNPLSGMNATFATTVARPGSVGFISQSGALCTAVLDWSLKEMVGFSAFVSVGSMVDVGWGDLIYHLGDDPNTRSIVIYMESIGNARSFLSAAREVALTKPIIVIKPGRTAAAAKAAASHTGSLTGSDEVLEAAFRRSGVLRVNNISDLFYMAEVLAKQPRPKGPRLTIVTNAGGPGVLATDALIMGGGELSELSPEAMQAYNQVLPATWSHNNPVDIIGDASPERYSKALEIAAKDPNSDGMLVILTPQAMTDPTRIAEQLTPLAKQEGKPLLASWMGGLDVAAGEQILNRAGIPTFPYPDTAARAFNYMWQYSYNLRGLYETPSLPEDSAAWTPDRKLVRQTIDFRRLPGERSSPRDIILTEFESKQILAAYGIPVAQTIVATTSADARKAAGEIGYPVVLKLYSETITHKTDVGGVQLSLSNPSAVEKAFADIQASVAGKVGAEHFQGVTVQPMINLTDAYELIIGSSLDPQFGPVLLFGTGGQLVEVFKDRALALPPLNTTLARRMMEQTKIYKALKGVRGRKPVDLAALETLIVRFSALVAEQRWIKEIDINPLLVSPDGLMALDARVVLHGADVKLDQIPKSAIRPYPTRYMSKWTTKDGTEVMIRPIRPEDEPAMVKFHETLSERTVYLRYFHLMNLEQRTQHDRLTRICFIDYDREMALVAESNGEILGVGRLMKVHGADEAEVAAVVSDRWQGKGLGKELLARLLIVARDEKLTRVTADILPDNRDIMRICEKLGFTLKHCIDDEVVRAEFSLSS